MVPTAQLTVAVPTPIRPRAFLSRPGSPLGQKQLSPRCGSISAPDPFATRSTSSARGQLSRLTIVRVPQTKTVADAARGGGMKSSRPSLKLRTTSSPTRLSFASASFSAPNSPVQMPRPISPRPGSPSQLSSAAPYSQAPGRPLSPVLSAKLARSNSNTLHYSSGAAVQLSPKQVYDLAKVATRTSMNQSPVGYALPESFTELTDDVFLPFLDRPSEVRALISSASNARMMMHFAHILPPSNEEYYERTSCELAATIGSWCFEDFVTWLTEVSREEIEDEVWVRALRTFVLPKSEVLWEKLKSVLGIPPELDVDPHDDFTSHDVGTTVTRPKEPALNIIPIRPSSVSANHHLVGIAEDKAADGIDEILGLRITTPIAFPPSAVKNVTSAPCTRARTPYQSTIPVHSSPLAPKTRSPPKLDSTPASRMVVKNKTKPATNGGSVPVVKAHSKEAARPLFPTSFDKLGCTPALLSVR
ncbi:uncharacterized protein FOMMEDRAFT_16308 [Fomitiporia mediterranea MF3/22]|uniref:uncharacterized protein n=1 Tax=Fomitiporia mediterranea (strain MF3/22) TaxID=694068 RepID=UPI0004408364|nr:uncharacterized protein FOMMEDRAFT_16308 [Fomitiporia mediterranea MF3/22]EJD07683.1 hypothetical protein FOMMEDRAFT_16308 [Fomitiporia mediterranea MF3/22]